MRSTGFVVKMSNYAYTAYDSQGVKVTGEIEAPSTELARIRLQEQDLMVLTVDENANPVGDGVFTRSRVSTKELEYLTSELSLLLNSGVNIDRGLSVIRRNATSAPQAKLITTLYDSVRSGQSLSEAMSAEGTVFSTLYTNLIALGESSGTLPKIFQRLSADIKFQSDLRRKILQALTYPLVILFVCILCIVFIFNYIVPQMSSLFQGLPEIPIYTAFLLSISDWFVTYQWILLMFVIAVAAFILSLLQTPAGVAKFNSMLSKIPGLNGLLVLVERIRFNTAITMTLQSGISIDKCLEMAIGTVKNQDIQQGLVVAKDRVKKGEPLSKALANSPLYTDFSLSLIEVGEESGQLTPVFVEITERARNDFENWVERFTSLLEPLLILIMGGIVGGVVVTMLLSIVSVNDIGL